LLVDAAVDDAMADRVFASQKADNWDCPEHGCTSISKRRVQVLPGSRLPESGFDDSKRQALDTRGRRHALSEMGFLPEYRITSVQIIRIVGFLLLAIAAFMLPLLAWL
jgi:hypothetical protein